MNKQILSILTAGLALVSGLNAAPNFVQIATIPGNTTINGTKVTLIKTSQRWTADNVYILSNLTFVEAPAVLTIEPGTIIRMEQKLSGGTSITDPADPGTLIICRGAKIVANGTAESPIVFTSIDDPYVAGGAATIPTTENGSALSAKSYAGNFRFSRDSLCGGLIVLGKSNLGFGAPGSAGGLTVALSNGGSGYSVTTPPSLTVNGGTSTSSIAGSSGLAANGGTGAGDVVLVMNPTGVASVSVSNGGIFTGVPSATFASSNDRATCSVQNRRLADLPGTDGQLGTADDVPQYEITGITVTKSGGGYYANAGSSGGPTLTFSPTPTSAPTTTVTLQTTSVAAVTLKKPGVYTVAPTITIAAPSSGTTATVTVGLAGAIEDPKASPLTSGVGSNFIEGFQTIDGATLGQGSGSIYGGTDDNDNSGLIRFASIRYGGFILSPNNEINGLTTGATGRGTYFEFIEVVNNADDDFEHFGGLCNMKYVAGLFGGDDGIDIDQGYRGKIQFALQVQNNKHPLNVTSGDTGRSSSNVGDNLGEFDGSESPNTSKPYSVWTMFNYTGIGVGYGLNSTDRSGPNFKDNAGGKVFNSLYVNAPKGAVQIQGTATQQSGAHAIARFQEIRTSGGEFNELNGTGSASEPDAILNFVTWMCCGLNSTTDVATDAQLFPATSLRTSSGGSAINDANIVAKIKTNNGNNIFQGAIDLVSIDVFALDPRLKASVASRNNGVSPRTGVSSVGSGTAGAVAGAVDRGTFFTDNTFRGAMKDCNWLNGWSLLNEWGTMSEANNTLVPDVTLDRASGKLMVKFPGVVGVQYSVETSTDNKTFTPKQTITGAASNTVDLGASTALTFVRVLPL
ncbi:MAG: hypothetical protein QM531_04225 [Candidatus Pacebacteria bacterium]|nr:hypothetical protein [Candidatus Paceibacterota bacterium]